TLGGGTLARARPGAAPHPDSAFEEPAGRRQETTRRPSPNPAVIDAPPAKAIAISRGGSSPSSRAREEGRPPQPRGVSSEHERPRKPTLDEMGPGPDREAKPYRPGPRSTSGRAGMRGRWRPPGR